MADDFDIEAMLEAPYRNRKVLPRSVPLCAHFLDVTLWSLLFLVLNTVWVIYMKQRGNWIHLALSEQ
uniref:Uncharacterized protein n=1 Tax=Neogobius melanostomus TaxID=47308 RepID=A0A8C6T0E1_9GOBI